MNDACMLRDYIPSMSSSIRQNLSAAVALSTSACIVRINTVPYRIASTSPSPSPSPSPSTSHRFCIAADHRWDGRPDLDLTSSRPRKRKNSFWPSHHPHSRHPEAAPQPRRQHGRHPLLSTSGVARSAIIF
ncbi:hypothetical protein VC83_08306 [Pseudogymnoascus destructans]|uniref:Uncharacterized protein n=2 Tax=Pseudogymnoascus destructans TaxID=655981 RepID=L8FXX5_PSED2|nr:uncharacterized protein VC83_08306 [Pseudogymnoascus destructans]ELR05855.1 hypothetical protein GMDG_07628 [Pseudogymnoascus destructans 20631-21]OAF55451.1 hypothetical protein VC83_08306 [Pseudogymnoascus destructans]